MTPPCGVPAAVGVSAPPVSTPAVSQARTARRMVGMVSSLASRAWCEIVSKQPSMSASSTYLGVNTVCLKMASTASWQDRPGRKP